MKIHYCAIAQLTYTKSSDPSLYSIFTDEQMSVGSLDRDFSRRALTQKNGNTARAGLQLDIERLFAQQIRLLS